MIARAIETCAEALLGGNKLLFIGNGGSCSQAEHLAGEFVGSGFPAIALTNPSIITAIGNDYSFAEVFSRQIAALANEGDILFALSTSGQSANVIKGALAAYDKGCKIITMTGKDTLLCELAHIRIEFGGNTQEIQEQTIKAGHLIWKGVNDRVGGKSQI